MIYIENIGTVSSFIKTDNGFYKIEKIIYDTDEVEVDVDAEYPLFKYFNSTGDAQPQKVKKEVRTFKSADCKKISRARYYAGKAKEHLEQNFDTYAELGSYAVGIGLSCMLVYLGVKNASNNDDSYLIKVVSESGEQVGIIEGDNEHSDFYLKQQYLNDGTNEQSLEE